MLVGECGRMVALLTEDKPGKYLDDKTLDILIEDWGNDLSFRAKMSIVNIEDPREDREQNRQRMVDAATVYAGLRMLKEERRHD